MTCIVGVVDNNSVWLGGDRAATDYAFNRTIIKSPKIFVKSEIGIGICGLPKVASIIEHVVKFPKWNDNLSTKAYLSGKLIPAFRNELNKHNCTIEYHGQLYFEGAMLIALRGELYQLEGNFQVIETARGYDAVGSGAEPALGSLRATVGVKNVKKRILKALEVSAENNAGVAPPFDVLEII